VRSRLRSLCGRSTWTLSIPYNFVLVVRHAV
jgi:hypothetical protein